MTCRASVGYCFGRVGSGFCCSQALSLLLSFGELLEILDRKVGLWKARRELSGDKICLLQWDP